jgi:hydrogenase maturation protein HypF
VAEKGEAIRTAVACLRAGGIVALRGVGGYQLRCEAARGVTVARLRERKRRPAKPLAILVATLGAAQQCAELSAIERDKLCSPAGPIVTARARTGSGLAAAIHPGLDEVGLMLPTTPLHFLVAREFGRPLVCTSGNRDGEPLAVTVAEAEERLAGVADLFLHHDRPIERPVDDSVVRVIAGRAVTLRLGRGLAPLAIALPALRPLVALGGQQKAAIAISNGAQAALGPHVGDLDTLATFERYQEQVEALTDLYRLPDSCPVAADQHPD